MRNTLGSARAVGAKTGTKTKRAVDIGLGGFPTTVGTMPRRPDKVVDIVSESVSIGVHHGELSKLI